MSNNKETITSLFIKQVELQPDSPALMERQGETWVSETWKEWHSRSRNIASALIEDGVLHKDSVAIFSYSKRQWLEADAAILMAGARTSTIYQNLASESVHYIIDNSKASIIFVEGPIQLRALFGNDGKTPLPKSLKKIIYFQNSQTPLSRPGKPNPTEISLDEVVPQYRRDILTPFEDYVSNGRTLLSKNLQELESRIQKTSSSDIAKIIYTSGTTGTPKGALLSHENLCSVTTQLHKTIGISPEHTTLLFLPLAHVYAQLVYHSQVRLGFTIAFAQNMLTAVDDAASIKPHFFISVPRLFEKIYSNVLFQAEQGNIIKQSIFSWAISIGAQVSKAKQKGSPISGTLKYKAKLADKLVFSKLKKRLGGRISFMVSGGAPLQKHICEFFHAAGMLIIEGYGMTENGSLSHHNRIDNYKFGTVGKVLDNTDSLIADDGEILVRGPSVMKGYLGLEEETKESLDDAGWLHTGDIGTIDSDGFLTITDRKKDIIVTSGGKNIAPAPIETKLSRSNFISQVIVFGDNQKFLVAIFTLNEQYVVSWAKENGITGSLIALASNPKLKTSIETDVANINLTLETYESIKDFIILAEEFSIEKGEMTPSLKLRRRVIGKLYSEQIKALYPKDCGIC